MGKLNDNLNGKEYITLKEYVNDKFVNLEKAIDVRFESSTMAVNSALAAADKATSKAEMASEKRFEGVNEFRSQQQDLINRFILKSEVILMVEALNEKIDSLSTLVSSKNNKDLGQKEGMMMVGLVAGIVSTLVVLISRFIK